jgi:O-antigen/teichoic acid export membrane protein
MKQQVARLAKNTLLYGAGRALNRFGDLLLLPVLTTFLTPADYGVISILEVIAFIVIPVFSVGFGAAMGVCYFEGKSEERKGATIWTTFGLLAISTFVLAVLGIAFAKPISLAAFQTPEYHHLVSVFLLSTCLNILAIPFGLYLQFEDRAKLYVALTSFSMLASVSASIVMVVILGRGARGLVEGGLFARAVSLLLFALPVLRKIGPQFSYELGRELLRLGIPLVPSFAFVFVIQQSNKYFLQWFDGLESVGVYTVGFNLGLAMGLAVSAFTTAWYPFYMSFMDKQKEAQRLFVRFTTLYVLGFGTLALFFCITAKPVVMILTQPAFYDAHKIVGMSALAQFVMGVQSLLLPGMYFAKEPQYQSLVQGVAAIAAVAFNLLLIPSMGLLGAGLSLVLGSLALVVLLQLWNRRRGYLEFEYEWGRILAFSLFLTGYAVLSICERDFSLLGEMLVSAAAIALLLPSLYLLLRRDEKQYLWALIRNLAIRKYFLSTVFSRNS